MCTNCGICEDICPKKGIFIQRKNGELRPTADDNICNKCGKCLKVCPGIGIDFKKYQQYIEGTRVDKYIGNYIGLHTGYSLQNDIRFHSASGGMVSQFLLYLLEKKIIDGAVVTGYEDDHITPYSYIANNKEDIIKAKSSKYCPVALNKIGNEIARKESGKFVIVGLPCHVQGFRKRMLIDRKLKERVIGLFSIYCSSERTYNAQDYIFQHYDIRKESIDYFSYRDNGCLGNLVVNAKNKHISVPYTQFYGPMLRSFFKPHRCLTCIDHYGELADVSFGDIHIAPYDQDHIGISSWITRSDYWEDLFKDAEHEGYIKMDDVDADTLNRSQKAMLLPKKRRAKAVMNMDRLLGRKVPQYDKELDSPLIKDYFTEIVCHCQRFVGRHRKLWWIIELLNRNK